MANARLILFAERDAWRIGVVTRGRTSFVTAPTLPEALQQVPGDADRDVLLALGARDCLCASIATNDLPARQRAEALLYRLEEKLPVAAEDVVADFVQAGDVALGVAVEKKKLEPLIEAIAAAGKRVVAVCPASLLTLQQRVATSAELQSDESQLVLWSDGNGGIELFSAARGVATAWFLFPDQPDDVSIHIAMMTLGNTRPSRVVACGVQEDVVSRLRQTGINVIQRDSASMAELAAASASLVLAGKRPAWIDLADAASRIQRALGRSTAWAAAAAIILLMCTTAVLWVRASQYTSLAEHYDAQQQEVFERALPGQMVPTDVRSRLASEVQQGNRTSSSSGASTRSPEDGLIALRDVMSHLPSDVRFRIYEVRLDDGDFTLEGEAKSHGDAQGVGEALRRRGGFAVDPPSTEQRPGGAVRFTIAGNVVGDVRASAGGSR